jgi:hypothetical protein
MSNNIQLQSFITATLDAVEEAMKGRVFKDHSINVEFEIGIEAIKSNSKGAKAGVGIRVAEVLSIGEVGGKLENKDEKTSYNRLKFTIPLRLKIGREYIVE